MVDRTTLQDSALTEAQGAGAKRAAVGRFGVTWRRAAAPVHTPMLMASGLFNAQVWVERSFWRPAALWAGVAGALTAGVTLDSVDWRMLALALLLVDVLWGSVWRLAGGREQLLPLSAQSLQTPQRSLPYLQPGSPAARLLAGDHHDLWPLALRAGAPALLLALLVAAVLGAEALVLTVAVIIIAGLGWTARHTLRTIPIVLASVVSIGLPWLLTLRLMTPPELSRAWLPALLLLTLWVLHHWGEVRIVHDTHDAFAMVCLGASEIGLCVLLVWLQAPLWLAVIVLLVLPAWLAIAQGHTVGTRMQPLWLLALLVSALTVGQAS